MGFDFLEVPPPKGDRAKIGEFNCHNHLQKKPSPAQILCKIWHFPAIDMVEAYERIHICVRDGFGAKLAVLPFVLLVCSAATRSTGCTDSLDQRDLSPGLGAKDKFAREHPSAKEFVLVSAGAGVRLAGEPRH